MGFEQNMRAEFRQGAASGLGHREPDRYREQRLARAQCAEVTTAGAAVARSDKSKQVLF